MHALAVQHDGIVELVSCSDKSLTAYVDELDDDDDLFFKNTIVR